MATKRVSRIWLLCLLLLCPLGSLCFADVVAQLKEGETLREAAQYQQAEQIYRQVAADYPGTDYAFAAQKGLAIVYVRWNKPAEAEAAFEQLKANYSNRTDFSGAVCVIGDNYRWKGMDEKARRMYQIAVEGISGSEAIWPKMGLAITSIRVKDYHAAEPLIEQILTGFPGDGRLATACCLIGDAYRSARRHRQAIDLYQYVIDKHGECEYAMWSQMGIAICNIDLGKKDAAESAIETLCTNYASHPSFYKAVRDIGDNYRWRDIHDKARDMYQLALAGLSGAEAFWPKAGIAIASVHLKDYQTAEALTEQIRTEFANHAQLPEAICLIGGAYRSVRDYEKALGLYQLILQVWPRSEQALWTRAGMAGIAIAVGDEAAAQVAVDNLIADFSKEPASLEVVFRVGQEYYKAALRYKNEGSKAEARNHFAKAVAIWERVVREFPPSAIYTPWSYCLLAHCCFEYLGEYEKAIESCQEVVIRWATYEYAWYAQFLVGNYYERLAYAGLIAESDANPSIEQAYRALIENYPDCNKFKNAALKLAQMNFDKTQWAAAAMYYEMFLTKSPPSDHPAHILHCLGLAYDNMGQVGEAIRIYNEFLSRAYPSDPRIETVRRRIEQLAGSSTASAKRILSDVELSTVYGGCELCGATLDDYSQCEAAGNGGVCENGSPPICTWIGYCDCKEGGKHCFYHPYGFDDCVDSETLCSATSECEASYCYASGSVCLYSTIYRSCNMDRKPDCYYGSP